MMYNCRPAIIVSAPRAGGTLLASCLSNHPDIFCVRGEPLLDEMPWKASLPGVTDAQILLCIFTQFGYKVGACKVMYSQLASVLHLIRATRPKIIHLIRENVVRCCLSQLMTGTGGTHAHGSGVINDTAFAVDVGKFVEQCRQHVASVDEMQGWMYGSGLESIIVTYEEMVGGEGRSVDQMAGQASNKICGFLGVDYPIILKTHLRKVNPPRMRSMVMNWSELRAALAVTEFAELI